MLSAPPRHSPTRILGKRPRGDKGAQIVVQQLRELGEVDASPNVARAAVLVDGGDAQGLAVKLHQRVSGAFLVVLPTPRVARVEHCGACNAELLAVLAAEDADVVQVGVADDHLFARQCLALLRRKVLEPRWLRRFAAASVALAL